MVADIERLQLAFTGSFHIPVIATDEARALQMDSNLMATLVRQICVDKVAWQSASTFLPATHILDFGPGHTSGIGSITQRIVDGSGVQVFHYSFSVLIHISFVLIHLLHLGYIGWNY